MKASEINDWLGVITNVGVIAGLILVAYEIHQNSLELDRESRVADVETLAGIRDAWQNYSFAIIENEDVADIWIKGSAGESLTPSERLRFDTMAGEYVRLTGQNYSQFTTISGTPADWAVAQLANRARGAPGLRCALLGVLDRGIQNDEFVARIKELDPPELRSDPNQPCGP